MFLAKKIATGHKDLIHDIAYDFHGRRIATSSCDQNIKVGGFRNFFVIYEMRLYVLNNI